MSLARTEFGNIPEYLVGDMPVFGTPAVIEMNYRDGRAADRLTQQSEAAVTAGKLAVESSQTNQSE